MLLFLIIFLFWNGATASRALANLLLNVLRRLSVEEGEDIVWFLAIYTKKFEVTSGVRQRFF